MNRQHHPLEAVAAVLDRLATGGNPERATLLAAALALNTYCNGRQLSRDLLDAAAGLESLATGGMLELDATGRQRAAALAMTVRQAPS